MKPSTLFAPLLFSLVSLGVSLAAVPAAARQPNIVFILADDLGWNSTGPYGNRDVDTPNLDRLAAAGLRFTSAYAEAQCSPARAAFFSGQYGARTGMFAVTHEKDPLHAPLTPPPHAMALTPDVASLARTLRAAGYATGLSGKWHIGGNYNAAPLRQAQGGKYFANFGFDYVGAAANARDKSTTGITDDLLGFITAHRDRPFFACFMHHTPHAPMEARPELVAKYVARGFKKSSSNLCVTAERPTADYYAMLEHLDTEIGRVLAKLDELGLAQDTIVIFTADNGGLNRMSSMAPLREAKGAPYEGGLRVPLIVRWPGRIVPGTTTDVPMHFVDFYPTFLDVAGLPTPAGHVLDGVSLMSLWCGGPAPAARSLFWHMPTYTAMYGRTPCAVVRDGGWKLVHYFGDFLDTTGQLPAHEELYGRLVLGARTELYRLSDDLGETHDLAAAHPEKVAALMAQLRDFWQRTGAALPVTNAAFRADDPDWWRLPGQRAE